MPKKKKDKLTKAAKWMTLNAEKLKIKSSSEDAFYRRLPGSYGSRNN